MALSVFVVILGFLVAGFVYSLSCFMVKYRSEAPTRKLPGPKPTFLFGNSIQLEREPYKFVEQMLGYMNHYSGGLFCLWLGPVNPVVLTYKPELAEVLVSGSKHTSKSILYEFLHPWLGTGLLTSGGSKWKHRRRLITPTFHFKILNDFIQVFEEQAEILVRHLQGQVNKGVFNIMPYIAVCALDIICITAMDNSANAQENADSAYVKAVVRMSELVQMRQKSPWLWPDFLYSLTPSGREHDKSLKILHGFTNKVIDERIADRAANNKVTSKEMIDTEEDEVGRKKKRRQAFLDILLESYDAGDISREGVREEVDTFMFEGHDTTTAGITWALYLVGNHPAIQARVCEEVDTFFETRPDKLTVDDLKELQYLECVIKEAQRMFPSVPFFARTTSEDCHLNGDLIPKGTTVGVAAIGLHRNPEVWPAPYQFDPDRFLPENSQGRHPYAFVPFSAGPRNCIGQKFAVLEEKIILSYIFRHFSVQSTQSFSDLKTCGEIITRPKEGIFVTLASRRKNAN